jgi:dolichol-phosphate mannosyltransferase
LASDEENCFVPVSYASPAAPPAARKLRVLAVPVAFNEERKIGSVIDRFNRADVDAIVVFDDGSTDGTPEAIRERGIPTLRSDRTRGVGNAIRTIITHAKESGYDVVVILAGNDKDRPLEIPRLLEPIVKEGCDFVQGSRYMPGGDFGNMPIYRRIATQFVHPLLFSLIVGRRITDSTNGFRAMRLSLFDDPRINLDQDWLDKYELEPYIFYKAITLGYKVKEVPCTKIYPPHGLGYTKMKPITGWWSILRPLVFLGLGLKK